MSSFEAPLDQSAASDTSSSSNNEELRNYHLSIEYKHLQTHSPSGVYLLPHSTLLRSFSGVIFLRRGIYQNAIFKFQVDCGDDYNSPGCSPPKVTFVNPNGGNPYHPLVDSSGALDVKSLVGTWDSKRCFLITLLTFVKKAFYIKEFHRGQGGVEGGAMRCERWANEAAFEAFANNREAFIGFVKEVRTRGWGGGEAGEGGATLPTPKPKRSN